MTWNKYYLSEWSHLKRDAAYELSKGYENEVMQLLLKRCGFTQVIPTRDSIVAHTTSKYTISANGRPIIILPDLFGSRNGRNYFIEVKRKNRRLRYNDTGFDMKYIHHYLRAEKAFNAPVVVVFKDNQEELTQQGVKSWFVDENGNEKWYGEYLEMLHSKTPINNVTTFKDPHSRINGKIQCFPLKYMKPIEEIWRTRQSMLVVEEQSVLR